MFVRILEFGGLTWWCCVVDCLWVWYDIGILGFSGTFGFWLALVDRFECFRAVTWGYGWWTAVRLCSLDAFESYLVLGLGRLGDCIELSGVCRFGSDLSFT